MEKAWVRSIRRQCRAARVPFFFKQWGGVRKNEAGRLLDGRTYDEFPKRAGKPSFDPSEATDLLLELESAYAL
jgi:protein gp37